MNALALHCSYSFLLWLPDHLLHHEDLVVFEKSAFCISYPKSVQLHRSLVLEGGEGIAFFEDSSNYSS